MQSPRKLGLTQVSEGFEKVKSHVLLCNKHFEDSKCKNREKYAAVQVARKGYPLKVRSRGGRGYKFPIELNRDESGTLQLI